jgi:RhoGAP domain
MLGYQRMMQLLPVINRDTLYVLLQFLGLVADNAEDKKADDGNAALTNKEIFKI